MSEPSSHKPVPSTAGSSIKPKPPGGPASSVRSRPPDGQQTVISSRPPTAPLDLAGQVPVESGSLWEGEQLGQFVLQKFVGGGGMGIVFRALDTTLDREVAVKVLSRDQSADEETLRRFRNEAQSAARLNHDNIARVFYVGEDRGVHYIVFEFIEGVNLRDLVEDHGPLPLDQALSYTYQIAQALDHASERSVIHRDIKPSNVLVTPDGKAKLVDMGLARLNQMAQASNDLTASGVTLGTFDYISPEQARDPRRRRRAQRSLLAGLLAVFHAHRPAAVPRGHGAAEAVAAPGRLAAGSEDVSARVAGVGHPNAIAALGQEPGGPLPGAGRVDRRVGRARQVARNAAGRSAIGPSCSAAGWHWGALAAPLAVDRAAGRAVSNRHRTGPLLVAYAGVRYRRGVERAGQSGSGRRNRSDRAPRSADSRAVAARAAPAGSHGSAGPARAHARRGPTGSPPSPTDADMDHESTLSQADKFMEAMSWPFEELVQQFNCAVQDLVLARRRLARRPGRQCVGPLRRCPRPGFRVADPRDASGSGRQRAHRRRRCRAG